NKKIAWSVFWRHAVATQRIAAGNGGHKKTRQLPGFFALKKLLVHGFLESAIDLAVRFVSRGFCCVSGLQCLVSRGLCISSSFLGRSCSSFGFVSGFLCSSSLLFNSSQLGVACATGGQCNEHGERQSFEQFVVH